MKMYDCDICQSAGSVNQWGFCEICGEDFEDPGSTVVWRESAGTAVALSDHASGKISDRLAAIGRDAA